MRKLLIIIFCLLTIFQSLGDIVFAEAGLSEAGRTEIYKYNEKIGIDVLPGGEGGEGIDSISLFFYSENPKFSKFPDNICSSQYISTDYITEANFHTKTYIQGDYLFSLDDETQANGVILNLSQKDISQFKAEKPVVENQDLQNQLAQILIENMHVSGGLESNVANPETPNYVLTDFESQSYYKQTLKNLGLSIDKAEVFNRDYIKAHYETLDIENLEGFGCFMMGYLGLFSCIVCSISALVVTVIVYFIIQIRKKYL